MFEFIYAKKNLEIFRKVIRKLRENKVDYHNSIDLRVLSKITDDYYIIVYNKIEIGLIYTFPFSEFSDIDCEACSDNNGNSNLDIAYLIMKEFQGKGLGKIMIKEFIKEITNLYPGVSKVGACVSELNPASQKVLEYNNFKRINYCNKSFCYINKGRKEIGQRYIRDLNE
jgi:ribosomal protein S18 acetylase RimI-like enzyme